LAFAVMIGLALTLMVLDRYDSRFTERVRTAVMDGVTPLLDVISRPVDSAAEMMATADELANLRSENARLRLQNERLLQWQQAARKLSAENEALRELTRLVPAPGIDFITARAVGDPGGAYVRSLLVNAGSDQGVAAGQAAITGEGLAGRVLQVGRRSARVLLITDINSRVPVVIGERRERAVLGGDNTKLPKLLYLDLEAEIQEGDVILTSGHGGVLPPGIPVGVVTRLGEDGARVTPFVDWRHTEYLRLVDYGMPAQLGEITQKAPGGRPR
jgi:rod shape-determining protein MreC